MFRMMSSICAVRTRLSVAGGRSARCFILSWLSLNIGHSCLVSSKRKSPWLQDFSRNSGGTKGFSPPLNSLLSTVWRLFGIKMVIKVYIASSTGSVAVSVYCSHSNVLPRLLTGAYTRCKCMRNLV